MALQLNGVRVYVAGPYTNPDPVVNTRAAIQAGDVLLRHGFVPFVPHLTLLFHLVCPRPYEDWLALDNAWIETCHAMIRLPGQSSGADKEVALAKNLGMPIFGSADDGDQLVALAAAIVALEQYVADTFSIA